jgi:multiple sugar transport system permease protein
LENINILKQSDKKYKKPISIKKRNTMYFYAFISPWIIGFLLFTVIPILASVYFALTNMTKMSFIMGNYKIIWFKNFADIITNNPQFLRSILNTFVYSVFRVFLGIFISLLVAQLLNRKMPCRKLFRVMIYVPAVLPIVGSAILWQQLFDQDFSLFNYLLSMININPINWLGTKEAMGSIIFMSVWCGIGPTMIILLAALQGVPQDLTEAAEIDGAGAFRKFINITIPMISSSLLYLFVIGFIGTLQAYAEIDLLTGYREETMTMSMHVINMMNGNNLSYASAEAWVVCVIVMLFTLLFFKVANLYVFYAGGDK